MATIKPSKFTIGRLIGVLLLAAIMFWLTIIYLISSASHRARFEQAWPPSEPLPVPMIQLAESSSSLEAESTGNEASAPVKAKAGKKNNKPGGDDLFNGTNVVRLRIDIPKSGMDALRRTHWGGGNGGNQGRTVVKATVREGDRVYTNVAVHLKGAAGSFRPVDSNPALTLNFDKFAPGQNFHGLHKISLNNSVQDGTFLAEKICRELFDQAGVPVPRADHAVVNLNGRDLGLYVLVEGFNKQFLKRYFKNVKGNLYDGGFCREITDHLSVNSGDNPNNQSDLRALAAAAMDPNPSTRMARLEKVLDVDRFLTMIAMEVLQCHWDGYALNRNNWRIYHDLDSDRMVFMPHGLDQVFGVGRGAPNTSIAPHGMNGMVANQVIRTPEGRRRYLQKMAYLVTNVFDAETVVGRVRAQAAKIRPIIAERNRSAASQHDRQVKDFCDRIRQRGQNLALQISVPPKPLPFDNQGIARLTDWKQRTISGNPVYGSGENLGGRRTLHVTIADGKTVGTWRTRVVIGAGRYRFEGRIKTKDVAQEGGEQWFGAGLRVSGATSTQKLSGNADWTNYAYAFEVQEAEADVELICELRAVHGEAWFDVESLKLVRF